MLSRETRTRREPWLGPLRQPSETKHGEITLDLSAATRKDKETTKEDKRTKRQTGEGGKGGGKKGDGAGTSQQAREPIYPAVI